MLAVVLTKLIRPKKMEVSKGWIRFERRGSKVPYKEPMFSFLLYGSLLM